MRFPAVILILFCCRCLGASYYVSNVSANGDGSFGSPFSITNAFTNKTTIVAGDTVWMRAGTYQNTNLWTVNLYAVSNNPIVIRNYNRERVILDGGLALTTTSNVWFWGLEIIDTMRSNRSNPFDTISGVDNYGTKFINCLIHDTCIGLAGGPYEAYGNVMWNNGKVSTEHAIYWQNDDPNIKAIENNLIGYASGFGVHNFGSAGQLSNFQIQDNSIWMVGSPLNDGKACIYVSGEKSVTNLVVNNNDVIQGGRGIQIGSVYSNRSARVTSNRVWANRPYHQLQHFDLMTVTNNTFGHADDGYWLDGFPFFTGTYTWNRNTYWSARFPNHDVLTNGTDVSFAAWQGLKGFDANSTLTQNSDITGFLNMVIVRTNRYDNKRGSITIWNSASNHNVSVDISSVVPSGYAYSIRNAQDYWGAEWVGVYQGGSVSLPMTNLSAAPQLYWTPVANNVSTGPLFAAFTVQAGEMSVGQRPLKLTIAR